MAYITGADVSGTILEMILRWLLRISSTTRNSSWYQLPCAAVVIMTLWTRRRSYCAVPAAVAIVDSTLDVIALDVVERSGKSLENMSLQASGICTIALTN